MPQLFANWQENRITTDATTVVLNGTGCLHGIFIESLGTSPGTATIYDNTAAAGTIIAIIDTDLAANEQKFIEFNRRITTGITVVTSAGVTKAVIGVFFDSVDRYY